MKKVSDDFCPSREARMAQPYAWRVDVIPFFLQWIGFGNNILVLVRTWIIKYYYSHRISYTDVLYILGWACCIRGMPCTIRARMQSFEAMGWKWNRDSTKGWALDWYCQNQQKKRHVKMEIYAHTFGLTLSPGQARPGHVSPRQAMQDTIKGCCKFRNNLKKIYGKRNTAYEVFGFVSIIRFVFWVYVESLGWIFF